MTTASIPACAPPRPASRPRILPPAGACCTHAHVFGPAAQFPYAADRSYTPPDAPREMYLSMLDTLGLGRGVLVQGSAHGRDNAAMLDALERHADRLRGVAVADADVAPDELRRWARLGVRGLRFNHFFRGGALHYRGGVPLKAARTLAPVMAELGWHLQLWIDVKDLPDTIPALQALGLPAVIDHMGMIRPADGIAQPAFQAVQRLLRLGHWVKLSGAYRLSQQQPPYRDLIPYVQELVAARSDRIVWASDWPHAFLKGQMPNTTDLLDMLSDWIPDEAARRRVLVDNPAALYGFA